jgi:hypothetical protein
LGVEIGFAKTAFKFLNLHRKIKSGIYWESESEVLALFATER